ncbi:sigma-70 family RNA polymerase sigma factor [Erythrobacter sp. SG61-1L]|uniref:sigma-70 family RNA polymerase sigma factor n=1 Tax=Erythrobacter sp. SG61-1L TaxID=1603897 RepID=UPI000A98E524|nr:sigma-70 family RNA polymerase sigma factor [Erythrobacter sp. SG61-1L]
MVAETPDAELIVLAGRGDVCAFGQLVDRHVAAAYRSAFRILHDRFEAEDVTQETFARLWRRAPRWAHVGAGVGGWVHRVCVNLCIDRVRQNGRWRTEEITEFVDPALPADRRIEHDQIKAALDSCLQALPCRYRTAIVLTYFEGYSNRVAAELLDMDIKAFESLLHRARRKLGSSLFTEGVVSHDLDVFA